MFIIYDLIFLVFAIIYLPIYLFRRKFHRSFLSRLGVLPKDLALDRPIWIHAVSVGEVMAIRGFIGELRIIFPNKRFVISTVTPTGNKIARSIAKENDFVSYLPLDFSFIIKNVIDKINPSLFIIAETEIWPNLISCLYQKNIPMVVVNGRISDRSFGGYLRIKFLLKPILNKINIFCVQTNLDARRLERVGVSRDKIHITGNMKFDTSDYTDLKKDYTDVRKKLGLEFDAQLLVAGSTHPTEEEVILGAYKGLLSEFSQLRLLVAPRHPERAKDIEKIVIKYGFRPLRISQLNGQTEHLTCSGRQERANACLPPACRTGRDRQGQTVFILDTIGQLLSFYAIADIVFVGGSLIKKGGHNILEPASQEKPILFGPYMFNFRDIAELFLKNQAAILVHNQEELKEKVKYLLCHPLIMDGMGEIAKNVILQNQGATLRNSKLIINLYERLSL